MVESVSLSAAHRSLLTTRTRLSDARDQATNNIATGRKVSKATDDVQKFFLSKDLVARVDDLNNAKSSIGQGISALQATQSGLEAADQLARQLKNIATLAKTADASGRAALATQFDSVRTQLNNLVDDVSYDGVNLLSNPADTLRVQISEQPSQSLDIAGIPSDASGLGVGTSAGSYGGLATAADIDAALTAVDSARSEIRATEASIVRNAGILGVREEFTENLAHIIQTGADKLVEADLSEESAKLLSGNVRDSLALQALKITTQSDRLVGGLLERS